MDIDAHFRGSPPFDEGRAEAESEIALGKLGWRAFGKMAPWEEYARLLQDEYRITYQVVGACIVELETAARAHGYNERMATEIKAQFGSDVVAESWRRFERKQKKDRGK